MAPVMERRHFLKTALAGSATAPGFAASKPPKADVFVGLQIAPFNLLDEGIERALDHAQLAGTNAIFLYTHTFYGVPYGRPPAILADDHGIPVRDESKRQLWPVWVRHHREKFSETPLWFADRPADAEFSERDLFAELREPLNRRGIKLYGRILEPEGTEIRGRVHHYDTIQQIDVYGKPHPGPCRNHPGYRAWWAAIMSDLFETYDLDGFQWGSEYNGPLAMLLTRGHVPFCFCQHCRKRAENSGTDPDRARIGFEKLHRIVNQARAGESASPHGPAQDILGLFLQYPEILAWETLWRRSLDDLARLISKTVKAHKPDADFGCHVESKRTTLNPISRAGVDYADLATCHDFIKPILYHDVAGPRMAAEIAHWHAGVLPQMPPAAIYQLFLAFNQYDPSFVPGFDRLDEEGFGPEYVSQEIKRIRAACDDKARVLAGIGIDVPKGRGQELFRFPSPPEKLAASVHAALDAGSAGILLSREYDEMSLPSLKAVGAAVRARS